MAVNLNCDETALLPGKSVLTNSLWGSLKGVALRRNEYALAVFISSWFLFYLCSRAAIMDRMKKKKMGQTAEWSRNGSFLNKPEVGWLHPDNQLTPDAGICYGVRVSVGMIFVSFLILSCKKLFGLLSELRID